MRDWTKAMAALLAAVSCVALGPGVHGQDAKDAPPALKADNDPFAPSGVKTGTDLAQPDLKVSDLNSIDLHVNDANLLDVLRSLADKTRKNIITSKSVGGKVTANLYGVTFTEAMDAILHANGYAYRERGNFIYVYTTKELTDVVRSERKLTMQTFRLSYVTAAAAKDMLKPALSEDAVVSVSMPAQIGIAAANTDAGGNSFAAMDMLVITDYEDNMERIRAVLKEIDRRPQQVLVEATILQATLSDTNSLGIDFTIMGGVDFSSVGSTNSAALTGNTFTPTTPGSTVTPSATPESTFANNGFNTVGTNIKGSNTAGLNVGIVYNNVAMFLNALESITDTNILANPKVLTVNKQPGVVIVGRKDGYVTSTSTSTTTVQTVEYLETGTRLLFRPFIGDDGYIRMEIHPEDSTGQVVVTQGLSLPQKATTEVTTNVLVKDGHTIVIGGLFREDNNITKSQVPLLGDIPWAGALFRSQTDNSKRQEIILLLTPHIIKDEEAYSEASKEQMKSADLLRVGLRQGMMPWGRDRLAEMAYTKAREETNLKYCDRERAMWYLDCATSLNPSFLEALQLKEQVSGKQIIESDGSSIRRFISDVVANEQATKKASEPTTSPADVLAVPAPAPANPAEKSAPAADPAAAPAVKELPAAAGTDSSNK